MRAVSSAAASSARRFSSARRRSSSLAELLACSSRRRASSSAVMRASSASRRSLACNSLRVVMSSCGDGLRAAGAAGLGAGAGVGAGASATGAGASGGGASPGRPRMRRFLTSTTTVLERPWLKLCFTLPVATVRLRPSGGRVPSFGFSVWSAILFLRQIFVSRAGPQGGFSTFQTTIGASESPPPGKRVSNTRSGGGIGQRDMYHILAPECHGQDSAPLGKYHPPRFASADPPGLVERPVAVLARVSRVNQQMDLAGAGRGLDLVVAVDEVAGA